MKKALRLFMLLIAALCAFGASAADVTFTLNIDKGAEGLSISYYDYSIMDYAYLAIHDGTNEITVADGTYLMMETNSSWGINTITWGGVAQDVYYPNSFYLSIYADDAGKVLDITMTDLDAARTGTFYVNVDDVSRVSLMYGDDYLSVSLKDGMNTVKFDPATESEVTISSLVYDKPIYEVLLDGVPVTASGSNYIITVTEGCVITINSHVPDKDITLTFNYNETGEGAIAGVKVEEKTVADFDGKTVNLKAGQSVALIPNTMMCFDKVKQDGEDLNWAGNYEYTFIAMDNMVFDIEAHPYATFNVTVKVNDPEKINVYSSTSKYAGVKYELTGNENVLKVVENDPNISWEPVNGYKVTSVKKNGTEINNPIPTYIAVAVDDVLEITVEEIIYDSHLAVYVNDGEAFTSFSIMDKNYGYVVQTQDVPTGYTVYGFFKDALPLGFSNSTSGGYHKYVYLNEQLLTGNYGMYSFSPVDGDCLKVFVGEEPTPCTVEFQVADDVDPVVTRDILRTLDDLTAAVTCLPGTQFNVSPGASTSSLKVTLNDADVPVLDETANHQFIISEGTNVVKIEKGLNNGVGGLDAERNAAPVYNLQGVRVANGLENLPAGIYITRGRKVVVK